MQVSHFSDNLGKAALLTSQAVALCDQGRWQEAAGIIQLAIACGGGPQAYPVRFRIVTYLAACGRHLAR